MAVTCSAVRLIGFQMYSGRPQNTVISRAGTVISRAGTVISRAGQCSFMPSFSSKRCPHVLSIGPARWSCNTKSGI